MYIIIEGIDTAGKSTQIDILKQKYPTAIFTKEPGATNLGTTIRELVLNGKAKSKVAEMFLFLADRAEHSFEVIRQNPDELIISDRGFISGIGYSVDVPINLAISLNLIALNGVKPDKIILLKLSKDELKKRLSSKKQDAIEDRGIEYLLKVQDRMIEALKELRLSYKIIEANQNITQIAKEIQEYIQE